MTTVLLGYLAFKRERNSDPQGGGAASTFSETIRRGGEGYPVCKLLVSIGSSHVVAM
jgi:hypothetical protein